MEGSYIFMFGLIFGAIAGFGLAWLDNNNPVDKTKL